MGTDDRGDAAAAPADPVLARLQALVERCARAGIACAAIAPAQAVGLVRPLAEFPYRDERVDWSGIEGGVCASWDDAAQHDALLAEALAACAKAGPVALIWNPHHGGLSVDRAEAAALARLLEDEASEFWLVPMAGPNWLIEWSVYDGELCYLPRFPAI